MPPVVDSHAHIFPDKLGNFVERVSKGPIAGFVSTDKLDGLKRSIREWYRPISSSMHQTQTFLRHLPESARRRLDKLGAIAPMGGLLIESTARDLKHAMQEAGIDYTLIIAHPTMIPNELVLETAQEDSCFVPVVNIPSGTARPGQKLKKFAEKGARALKIHPAADGEGVDSPRYKALLNAAADLAMPVIVHTGCIHSHVLYKDPELGHAQKFNSWFENYRSITFVLAHMNFHEPNIALDLVEEHPNVYVDTSWQPTEVIGEGVRRVGAERILFGTDWPFVGNNLSIGMKRVRDCVETGFFGPEQASLIMGGNAARLFKLS